MQSIRVILAVLGLAFSVANPARAGEVFFPDVQLREAVLATLFELRADPGPAIENTELIGVRFTSLDTWSREIQSLQGLEYATDLEILDVSGNQVTDISPLSNVTTPLGALRT